MVRDRGSQRKNVFLNEWKSLLRLDAVLPSVSDTLGLDSINSANQTWNESFDSLCKRFYSLLGKREDEDLLTLLMDEARARFEYYSKMLWIMPFLPDKPHLAAKAREVCACAAKQTKELATVAQISRVPGASQQFECTCGTHRPDTIALSDDNLALKVRSLVNHFEDTMNGMVSPAASSGAATSTNSASTDLLSDTTSAAPSS